MDELKRLNYASDDDTNRDIEHAQDKKVRTNFDNHNIFNPTVAQNKTEPGKVGTAIKLETWL